MKRIKINQPDPTESLQIPDDYTKRDKDKLRESIRKLMVLGETGEFVYEPQDSNEEITVHIDRAGEAYPV